MIVSKVAVIVGPPNALGMHLRGSEKEKAAT
jgi:hypothetical protein